MISVRTFAISTIALSLLVVAIELFASLAVPEMAASIERSKRAGDPEAQGIDVAHWQRMALVGSAIATTLSAVFIVSGFGLLARRRWARQLFLAASLGVVVFMVASCFHYLDFGQILHVAYALALFLFGYWFLYRSPASARFERPFAASSGAA